MPPAAQALLFVYGECGQFVEEDRFNNWYDNEHAPLRITVPGFLTASRYKALDAPPKLSPRWLALYDMTSKEVMQSQSYKDLQFKASENEKQVVAHLEMLNRRVYDLMYSSETSSVEEVAKFIYVVHMQVMGGGKDEQQDENNRAAQETHFIQWYTSTRISLLAVVPGYLRSRVYRLAEHVELAGKATGVGVTPVFKYVAIHEWSVEGTKVTDTQEFKKCMTDAEAWKMEGEEAVAEMQDRMFGLYKVFDHA